MDASELREKTADELNDKLLELKREAFNIRFRLAEGDFPNTSRIRTIKRDVARIKTVIREKEKA
ncbi:MAG: 50S ribosomal protein L29 [Rhodobacteraceae bacterium]|nr:50S ribosomal protein L29 [Paracoccaceae bacterium]MDE2760989.1 50S ribosomal protein L29 [Paracoccaceae bacterium]MDE2918021.1 50S ribosomal protein L29 [Paracoccaceae bacterium]MYE37467.1 50S ribosomal protein L29 [Paracoccaceae bacterium]MYG42758.1 50S ribosomal protein L29 [Paracoccaceae bacterium]